MTNSEINAAYLKGYEEATQRCQLTIASAVDEISRLRLVLEDALALVDEPTKAHIQSIMQRKR